MWHSGHAIPNAARLCWPFHLPDPESERRGTMTHKDQKGFRWCYPQSEKYLRSSGLEWTIVRCTYISQNLLRFQSVCLHPCVHHACHVLLLQKV